MAANSLSTPQYEYSKIDYEIILVFPDGEYPLRNRWESAKDSKNAQRGTMKGSGRTPRAHRATTYEPELSITTDKDTGDYIVKRANNRPLPSVKFVRQRPGGATITDVFYSWLPSYPDTDIGDDAIAVEIVGNYLRFVPDTQGKNASGTL